MSWGVVTGTSEYTPGSWVPLAFRCAGATCGRAAPLAALSRARQYLPHGGDRPLLGGGMKKRFVVPVLKEAASLTQLTQVLVSGQEYDAVLPD